MKEKGLVGSYLPFMLQGFYFLFFFFCGGGWGPLNDIFHA